MTVVQHLQHQWFSSCRFPNMCVANITRDSVREALTRGITAGQVNIDLSQNAFGWIVRLLCRNSPKHISILVFRSFIIWRATRIQRCWSVPRSCRPLSPIKSGCGSWNETASSFKTDFSTISSCLKTTSMCFETTPEWVWVETFLSKQWNSSVTLKVGHSTCHSTFRKLGHWFGRILKSASWLYRAAATKTWGGIGKNTKATVDEHSTRWWKVTRRKSWILICCGCQVEVSCDNSWNQLVRRMIPAAGAKWHNKNWLEQRLRSVCIFARAWNRTRMWREISDPLWGTDSENSAEFWDNKRNVNKFVLVGGQPPRSKSRSAHCGQGTDAQGAPKLETSSRIWKMGRALWPGMDHKINGWRASLYVFVQSKQNGWIMQNFWIVSEARECAIAGGDILTKGNARRHRKAIRFWWRHEQPSCETSRIVYLFVTSTLLRSSGVHSPWKNL